MQILRFFAYTNIALSPAAMHRFYSLSRPLLSSVATASHRRWPPAVARRAFSLMVDPNQPARRLPRDCLSVLFGDRFPHASRSMVSSSRVEDLQSVKPVISCANDIMTPVDEHSTNEFIAGYGDSSPSHAEEDGMNPNKEKDERTTNMNFIYSDENACTSTLETIDDKPDQGEIMDITVAKDIVFTDDDYGVLDLVALPYSTHRDGSMYKVNWDWKKRYRIADRYETQLEAMMQSRPTKRCVVENGWCRYHSPGSMLQFFSVKVSKIIGDGNPVELYGYIAVRDHLERLINYLVNFTRDDPIVVEQGSLINMTGPKRGIDYLGAFIIEYDMRIKIGEQEKDDLQLIDGASSVCEYVISKNSPRTLRICGDYGTVEIIGCKLGAAVEATLEIVISEVRNSFNMCVDCFTSGVHQEIRLFDGIIGEPRVLKPYVVAVVMETHMDLKFKIGTGPDEHCCSFSPSVHGYDIQEMKIDSALISVKVTWSTLIEGWPAEYWAKKAASRGLE